MTKSLFDTAMMSLGRLMPLICCLSMLTSTAVLAFLPLVAMVILVLVSVIRKARFLELVHELLVSTSFVTNT